MQVPVSLLQKNEREFQISSKEIKEKKQAINTQLAATLDKPEQVEARKQMIRATTKENFELAFERYIGKNDLLGINFLELGYRKSKSVGRLRFFDLTVNQNALATAFLISQDLILTNHHVFQSKDSFKDAYIDFDYAYGIDGKEMDKISFAIDPTKFFYAYEKLDFAIVGIKDTDEKGSTRSGKRGYVVLNPTLGKAGTGDYANIIQHPDGNWQQLGMRENQILDINREDAIIYSTDTSNGTSGSPVFNDQWQLIALHSAGVAKKNARDQYLDKDDQVIEEVDGKIDSTRIVWCSNTGIRVSSIMNQLAIDPAVNTHPFIQFLQAKEYCEDKNGQSAFHPGNPDATEIIHPTDIKPPIMENNPSPVIITININNSGQPLQVAPAQKGGNIDIIPGLPIKKMGHNLEQEIKYDEEMNADYSACKGFDTNFLGFETPLPVPEKQLERQLAKYLHNKSNFVLDYYHYSTLHHSVRCMPVVSAINIEGDLKFRTDESDRKDKWMRDNRIDIDVQLDDDYYKLSGFDKGHMTRREDANWGKNDAAAKISADMTCMYTNACPQVPALNRAVFGYHGLWGQLEQIVLENGAEQETGRGGRICVYNGPIFVDTDPVFKAIQIPLRFFKIIAWKNAKKEQKTTAFILSQEDLVDGIQFEELHYDKVFKEHQCSVAYIEKLTGLKFKGIREFDTFKSTGGKIVKPVDKIAVEKLVVLANPNRAQSKK